MSWSVGTGFSIPASVPVDVLGDQIRTARDLAHPVDRDDVGVREPGNRPPFGEESLAPVRTGLGRRDELDGNGAIQQRVMTEVDEPHAAPSKGTDNPVPVELRGWAPLAHRPPPAGQRACGASRQATAALASNMPESSSGDGSLCGMSAETGGTVKPTTGQEAAETPDESEDPTPETGSMGDTEEFSTAVRRFRLRGLDGFLAGQSFDSASDRLQIGSHPSNQVQIKDRTISRFHCEVVVEPKGRAWVKDLGSRNGTRVNGTRVREAELTEGAVLQLGRARFAFEPLSERNELTVASVTSFGSLVGSSVPLRAAFAVLEKAGASDVTVLLTGESGTGKSQAAEAVHARSGRASKPFRIVDCAAVPASLLDSELFGHERGAFTGATERRQGVFEEANGGTVFLDEIGELPADLQPKLLRVLEAREVRRVGSNAYLPVDVRLIAATNRDLRAEVNAGRFRADLYFRLAVLPVHLPPLRERPADIPLIAEQLIKRLPIDEETRTALLDPGFLARLRLSPWPGNVRELRNHLERCAALQQVLHPSAEESPSPPLQPVDASVPYPEARRRVLDAFERGYVSALLQLHEGNVSHAATAAQVDRVHLHRLIRRHRLKG
jgi:DNA-binding NtrC family response regulator